MSPSLWQITYTYKGETLTYEVWEWTEEKARSTFDLYIRKQKLDTKKVRIIKVRIVPKEERREW